VGEFVELKNMDPLGPQGGKKILVQQFVLVLHEAEHPFANHADLLGGTESRDVRFAGARTAQNGEPSDANLEELVEIRRGDGEEFETLQEGDLLALGFLEDALIEFEPGEFAIDEGHVRCAVGREGAVRKGAVRKGVK
jgi:hypothetical protein